MERGTTRTTHHHLAGIAAGGALLACGLIAFFSFVGGTAVSVWPESGGPDPLEVVELQLPSGPVELSGAAGVIAASDVLQAVTHGDSSGDDGGDGGPAEPPDKSPSPPGGGDAPSDQGAGTPPAPSAPPAGGPQQGREDDGSGPLGSENDEEDYEEGLLGEGDHDEGGDWGERGREVVWTPVPAPDPEDAPAGLSFSSGPEEGHDDTSWTNTDG